MNTEGPDAQATTLRGRWKGRLARELHDAPDGINSGHWHLFCAHTQQGKSLAELQAMNATTYPTVQALKDVLTGVEVALLKDTPHEITEVIGGAGDDDR